MVAASLQLLLPALSHTFISINEACNKRIREAKKAAETEAAAGRRQEGDEGVWGTTWPGLHRSSSPPWVHAPCFPHGHAGMLTLAHRGAHRHEEKRDTLTTDQPSIFERKAIEY